MTRPTEKFSWAVTRQAGISYRQLDHWVRMGWLIPETDLKEHKLRQWSEDEALIAAEMGRLTRAGMKPATAAELARRYVTEPTADGKYLIGIGVSIIFED
jgi:DNA-binding transcriptional MerR regulator